MSHTQITQKVPENMSPIYQVQLKLKYNSDNIKTQ